MWFESRIAFLFTTVLLIVSSHGFMNSPHQTTSNNNKRRKPLSFTKQTKNNNINIFELHATTPTPKKVKEMDTMEATKILASYNVDQEIFAKNDGNRGMGGGISHSLFWDSLSPNDIDSARQAVITLAQDAARERDDVVNDNLGAGRIMLGICAPNIGEALGALKTWVNCPDLKIPKGLLHGMDVDGVPIELEGGIFIKYSTGGAMTFKEMRLTGRGFDALWRPGDALVETYDGDFSGVHFNVELSDEVFRQYGVLPLNLFME